MDMNRRLLDLRGLEHLVWRYANSFFLGTNQLCGQFSLEIVGYLSELLLGLKDYIGSELVSCLERVLDPVLRLKLGLVLVGQHSSFLAVAQVVRYCFRDKIHMFIIKF